MPAGNVTITVTYMPKSYTIAFNGNGNTNEVTMDPQTVNYNASITLTANDFERAGYTFTGWNEQQNGSGKSFANSASITMNESTFTGFDAGVTTQTFTLYAQWTQDTNTPYTVNVYLMNVDGNYEDDPSYTNPTIEGSTGYYYGVTDTPVVISIINSGNEITFANNGNTNNISYTGFHVDTETSTAGANIAGDGSTTFNVYFARNSYTLTLEGGTGISRVNILTSNPAELGTNEFYYGKEVQISANVTSGYRFSNWQVVNDTTTPGGSLSANPTTITIGLGDTTLRAEALVNPYKLYISLGEDVTDATYGDALQEDGNGDRKSVV